MEELMTKPVEVKNFFERHILAQLVLILWIICLWELYLSIRQRKLMQKLVGLPEVLNNLLSVEVYDKSRIYALDKSTFKIIQDVYSIFMDTVFMTCWGFYYSWEWGRNFVEFCGLDPNNEIYVSIGCITVTRTYSMILCDLPFTIYYTFVLEQKHNFNNQTVLFFVKDQIIKFIVSQFLIAPLLSGMVWIVKQGGDYFCLYLWLFIVIMSLVLMMIYPEIVAPLFDKYTPLPEGDLRVRIEELASSVGFPLYKLYIVEGSRRSSHSNAYLYGFYKYKRIVLFDTLVAEYQKKKVDEENEKNKESNEEEVSGESSKETSRGCETDEIIAVLAHELGHWYHSHTIQGFLYGQAIILLNIVLFGQLLHYASIYETFGFIDEKPVIVGLTVILTYVLAPLNKLMNWLMTVQSRNFEFQADKYARSLGHSDALKRALIKLHKDNLGYPLYDKLYSNYHHSHPPLLERLDALQKDD
ncbi:PREDICTED: CAAX prenyl protease 1 homolog [Ceratosolen solmsi marchali]|uniref:CAAX prenyl protease n=1 Tax=Ceratosolen solmsi marchali TaxID=326594 RepID=A0AAJ6YGS2_9HYME|nr:PREDICTED: CAAX prenyl protease 1 homolog [Ceratosolen solmsi marchali]